MKGATSTTDFVLAPVGTFLAGAHSFSAPSAERLVILGSPDPSDDYGWRIARVTQDTGLTSRYDILDDVSAVEAMDRASFTLFEAFALRARRFALVKPSGLAGHMFSTTGSYRGSARTSGCSMRATHPLRGWSPAAELAELEHSSEASCVPGMEPPIEVNQSAKPFRQCATVIARAPIIL